MRRLRILLLLCALFLSYGLGAKVVSPADALKAADYFFNGGVRTRGAGSSLSLSFDSNSLFRTRAGEDEPSFYVFSADDGKGFVIVSGDDAVAPILGYSFESPVSAYEDMPENLAAWFLDTDKTIRELRSAASEYEASPLWVSPAAAGGEYVLETAKWNQGSPYNLQCPMDGDKLSITGCTATASAIVLRYYKWPDRGVGVTEEYTTSYKKINVPSRDLNHEYDWDNMPLKSSGDYSYSEEQKAAVSTLMADLGHAYRANYASSSTSAWHDPIVLHDHFKISPEVRDVRSEYYTFEQWVKLIRNEIDTNGPVLYSGYNPDSGHAFVLDGYNDEGYFHVNWGWGGHLDGFFRLDDMTPRDGGHYNDGQIALLNLVPDRGQTIENQLYLYEPGLVSHTYSYKENTQFTLEVTPSNNSAVPFSGLVRLAVTDKNGMVKEWISGECSIKELKPRYHIYFRNIRCVITGDIVVGDRIRAFYKPDGTSEWKLMLPYGDKVVGEILIVDAYTIEESTSVNFKRETGILTIGFKKGVIPTVLVDGAVVTSGVVVEETRLMVDTRQIGGESFVVRLEKDKESVEVNFTVKTL